MKEPCGKITTLRCGVGGWLCPDCTTTPPSTEQFERAVALLEKVGNNVCGGCEWVKYVPDMCERAEAKKSCLVGEIEQFLSALEK